MTVVEGLATGVVRIAATTERLAVLAEDRADIAVRGDAGVGVDDDVLTLDAHGHLDVRVPTGTSLVIGTTSGRIGVRGPVGSCSISTESGRVAVEHARRLDVRSDSGRVEVGTVEGVDQLPDRLWPKRIAHLGAVDRDLGDALGVVVQDVLVIGPVGGLPIDPCGPMSGMGLGVVVVRHWHLLGRGRSFGADLCAGL